MNYAICYYCYNRPDKTRESLKALGECEDIEDIDIYIFIDAVPYGHSSDDNDQVRSVVRSFRDNHPRINTRIVEWKNNAGPFISFTRGLEYSFEKADFVMRVEDDIIVRHDYIKYMRKMAEMYKDNNKVFAIGSYNPYYISGKGLFMSRRLVAWGYGIWKDRLTDFDWRRDGIINDLDKMDLLREILKEDSIEKQNLYYNHLGFGWAMLTEDVRLRNYAFIKNGYTIYSDISFSKNIGFDGSGVDKVLVDSTNPNFELDLEDFSYDVELLSVNEDIDFSSSLIRSYCKNM